MHLSLDIYSLLLRGALKPGTFVRLAHEHLRTHCDRCSVEWDALCEEHGRPPLLGAPPEPPASRLPSDRTPENPCHQSIEYLPAVKRELSRLRTERRRAREHLKILLDLPAEQRHETVTRAHTRFSSPALAEMLIDECHARVSHQPAEAESLAALVPAVLHRSRADFEPATRATLHVRSLAHRANALRVAGNLPAADRQFQDLHHEVRTSRLRDASLLAEIAILEASLRSEQRRFNEAHDLVDATLYLLDAEDHQERTRALLLKSHLFLKEGSPRAALKALRQIPAEGLSANGGHFRFFKANAEVYALTELGNYQEAATLLDHSSPLYQQAGEVRAHGNAAHLRGRIAHGLERHSEALEALTTSRDTYLRHERHYDAAVVALDLARVHLDTGRLDELHSLATDLVRIFAAHGVDREMLAALRLLAQAAQAREVSRDLLTRLRSRLELARHQPSTPPGSD